MALQVQLSANLTAGPDQQSDNLFPSGVNNFAFTLQPATKGYQVEASGVVTVASASPSFQAMPGVGTTVTQGHTLYCRSGSVQMLLQITVANPAGGADITYTQPIQGLTIIEFPPNGYLKALAVQGSGSFEYAVYGNQ